VEQYYIIDNIPGTFASFWMPKTQGRTYDLARAGRFSEEEIKAARYRNNPDILFIPCEAIGIEMTIMAVWNNLAKSSGDKFVEVTKTAKCH